MKFEIRDVFQVTPQVLWDSFLDPEIEQRLSDIAQTGREVLEERQDGDCFLRRVRYTSSSPAFAQVARLLGSDRFTFIQEHRFYASRMHLDWTIVPPVAGNQLKASGDWQIEPHADGAVRTVHGDVVVKVPIMGGRLEASIIEQLRNVYAKGADWRRRHLAERASG